MGAMSDKNVSKSLAVFSNLSKRLTVKCLVRALEARQLPPRMKLAVIPLATEKMKMLTDEEIQGYMK